MLWAAHPKPEPHELLSFWLVRLARANGQSLHPFCRQHWPGKALWNRDVDRKRDRELFQVLSERTGTSIDEAEACSLLAFEGRVYKRHNVSGDTHWILPLGIYHRTRRRAGAQFCPACLASPPTYIRRTWRFAWFIYCPTHRIRLQDNCPTCGAAFVFHRMTAGFGSTVSCHNCQANLTRAMPTEAARPQDLRFQAALVAATATSRFEYGKLSLTAIDAFDGLRLLASLLSSTRPAITCRWRRALAQQAHLPQLMGIPRAKAFEYLSIAHRALVLRATRFLVDDWPGRTQRCARLYNARASDIGRDRHAELPRWLLEVKAVMRK